MRIWQRLFHRDEPRDALVPLYRAVVAQARTPDWYLDGAVPDTLDGRFDMVALVLALVLFRLESLGAPGASPAALITELFVADMDGQLREQGVDYAVGKHIGKMMAALGGRLSAYRDVRGPGDADTLKAALTRNLYRGQAPEAAALDWTAARVQALDAQINAAPLDVLLAGHLG